MTLHIKTHETDCTPAGLRLGRIIRQRIFYAQSGISIHRAVWNWLGKTLFPGTLFFIANFSLPPINACRQRILLWASSAVCSDRKLL